MDVVREFRRGAVRLHVLHHASEGEISGVWMSTELGHHGYRISPGTLYPLLHAMEDAGLLSSTQRTEAGRALRYYTATALGRATLAEARAALAELAGELLTTAAPTTNSADQGNRCEESPVTMSEPTEPPENDPRRHTRQIRDRRNELISHLRQDVTKIGAPHAEALLETAAEVLVALGKAFADLEKRNEPAWRSNQ